MAVHLEHKFDQDSSWFVVYTIPKNEKKIYSELVKRAIPALLPLQKVTREWRTKKKKVELPMFPNYVFVKVPHNKLWPVLTISGVVRFIACNGIPVVVKNSEIELIKKLIEGKGEVIDRDPFRSGEMVQVTQGPFAGLEGEVLNIKGRDRFIVEFSVINKTFAVDVPVAFPGKQVPAA